MKADLIAIILRENRRLSIVTILAVLCCLLAVYGIHDQRIRTELLQSRLLELQRKQAALPKLDPRVTYRASGEAIDRLLASLPTRAEFPRVLGQLVDLAAASGVTLNGLNYKPLAASPLAGISGYALTCTASGPYPSLKRFLIELRKMDGLNTIDNVALAVQETPEVKGAMEVGMTIYLREVRQ